MATPEEIDLFCSHCDYKEKRNMCRSRDQNRYVTRNWCGWSRIDGTKLSDVNSSSLRVDGQWFGRDNIGELREYANERKLVQIETANSE